MSNPIALSDLYFYCALLPSTSIVITIKGIVCFVSVIVSFFNIITDRVWKDTGSLPIVSA